MTIEKETLETLKKISSLGELQLEVDKIAVKEGMSAKKKDQFFQKMLNDNMAGTKAMLSEGGNIGKLTTGMQKAVIDSYRSMGEEVNEGDEKRALQTQKELMEIAFQIKKGKLLEIGETATGLEKLGNSLKLSGLEASNMLSKNWINFQEKVADAADIKNLGNAISQDFSMLTTEFQGLMALPGMKTIVTGIKFIAAWLGKWLGVRLMAMWKARQAARKALKADSVITGPLKKDGSPDMRYAANKTQTTGLKGVADTKDTAGLTKKGKVPVPLAAAPIAAAPVAAAAAPKMGLGQIKRIMKRLTGALKKLSRQINKFVKLLMSIFVGAHIVSLVKGTKLFKLVSTGFTKVMGLLSGAFAWAAAGLKKMAKRMMVVIGSFLAAAYTFIAGTLLPAIAAFLFNPITLIVIGIIILLVLIAVGLYFLWDYISSKWETIKVKMKMAGDRLKLVGTKIANWFKDLGSDIGFLIKKMVAKIKDGFVWIVNATIEGFAKAMPDGPVGRRAAAKIRSFKMKGGYSDEVDAERAGELDRRSARDDKLEADFEAKYAERGKQLEEAKILDSERNIKKTGGEGTTVVNTTSTEIDQRQSYMTTESTSVPDSVTLDAIMQHG